MKKRYVSLLIIICISLFECKSNDQFIVKQISTNSILSISENYKELESDKVLVRYPLEFIIKKNPEVDFLLIQAKIDNKLQSQFNDYLILDENNKVIYNFQKSKLDKDLKFKIIFNYLPVSKNDLSGEQLILFNSLKRGDSIIIQENEPIIKKIKYDLNKKNDSIIIKAFSKDDKLTEKRFKVNW
ncbi:hypothetical protein A0O34_04825 [Chryseobacterium glaciei]|uniref:Uncharacterized protein n=1 Tax=Chryseobacterium glaciei TaxID=1685010 RepID=A0A172XSS8_9FLAO|nr:hypothetical protein [Chryseobacterium glaciei]ANF49892.1 hypothetical protein A0O34_04825 [Chryseobacterium glaciei]